MKIKNIWSRMRVMTGVMQSAGALFVITALTAILHGVSWGGITVSQQRFFDKVTFFMGKDSPFPEVVVAFLLLALAYVFCQVFNGAGNYVLDVMTKKMEGVLSFSIHKKIACLEPIDFEQADKLDVINKVEEGKKSAIRLVSTLQGMLCFYLPYFLFMSIYLFHLKPLLLLILPFIFLPTMLTQIIKIRMFGGIEDESAAWRRKVEYGQDIAGINRKNIFEKVSAVFQNFQRYNMTFDENIRISQTEKTMTEETMAEELDYVCMQSGIDIDAWGLQDGYCTMLGKEFGGAELSGGQWQRIAIARGYFRNHKVIMLDEPTSAIDPYEESNLYHTFAQMAKGKMAVLVTHRMGAVKIADRIIVLKAGRIVEDGTFEELMRSRDSEFQRMYSLQKHWYQEG